MPIQILDFEGSVDPENFSSLSSRDLKDRYIGYGCVDSSRAELETVETVVSRIRAGVDALGPERILLDPDCGLRMLPRDVAFQKLARLTEAAAVVRAEVSI